jgi:hypothetical protein
MTLKPDQRETRENRVAFGLARIEIVRKRLREDFAQQMAELDKQECDLLGLRTSDEETR